MQSWVIVDSTTDIVTNILFYLENELPPPNPHPVFPNDLFIQSDTAKVGDFYNSRTKSFITAVPPGINPSPPTTNPGDYTPPTPPISLLDKIQQLQDQINTMKSQISILQTIEIISPLSSPKNS